MLNPQLVTVFGGGGFIGRYVCEQLFAAGARVRVVTREPRHANFIHPFKLLLLHLVRAARNRWIRSRIGCRERSSCPVFQPFRRQP